MLSLRDLTSHLDSSCHVQKGVNHLPSNPDTVMKSTLCLIFAIKYVTTITDLYGD